MRPSHVHAPGLGVVNVKVDRLARQYQRRIALELGRRRGQQIAGGGVLEGETAGQGAKTKRGQQT